MTDIKINGEMTKVPDGAIAWKYTDPTEGARWVYDYVDLISIIAEDPSLIVETAGRYLVAQITSAACDSIHADAPLLITADVARALDFASHGPHPFGCGVLDTQTGLLDVGFGFGAAAPELDDCEDAQ